MRTIRPARFPLARHAAVASGADLLAVLYVRTTLHVAAAIAAVLVALARVAHHVRAAARCAHLIADAAALGALHERTTSRRAVLHALVQRVAVERALRSVVVSGVARLGARGAGGVRGRGGRRVPLARHGAVLDAMFGSLAVLHALLLAAEEVARVDLGIN